MASANTLFKSSEEYRRQKELEEARKAGIAPAELDEDGKEINPHIPQYMTNAPWYLNSDRPTLKHQKNWRGQAGDAKEWYDRGVKVFQATKFRKGACENCGAMSHKTKDCLERPRAKGARWTNKNIAADEKVQDLDLAAWDSKRDRWNGYDAKDYAQVIERYEVLDAMRQELKKKEQVEKMYKGEGDGKGKGNEEEDKYVDDDMKIDDEEDAGFGEVKKRVRTTAGGSSGSVRNLRIREDTAKYLLNLDMNSAHYDPKSRSMREDPNPDRPMSEKAYAGDNFVRHSGDYAAWESQQLHALQAVDKGQDIHMQAAPSMAEMLHQSFRQKKDQLQKRSKQDVLEKYGNVAKPADEEVRALVASERYVEYDRSGRVVKGQEVKALSKYEEDVHINNHTSVWGSWWKDGVWGYACCHQFVKNSYCTGAAGAAAIAQSAEHMEQNTRAAEARKEAADKAREESKLLEKTSAAKAVWGADTDADAELDPKKVEEALKKQRQDDKDVEKDERKRGFNSLAAEEEVTPEVMEAYRLKKQRADDPMAAMMANGGSTGGKYDLL